MVLREDVVNNLTPVLQQDFDSVPCVVRQIGTEPILDSLTCGDAIIKYFDHWVHCLLPLTLISVALLAP